MIRATKMVYYITAHGYGHGARSCDILNALRAAAPDVSIIVKTDLPERFMQSRLSPGFDMRRGAFDVGLVQKDSIRVDLNASLEALVQLYDREEELIQAEEEFIKTEDIGLVVADIPAIPLAAAQRAGIPNVATGNFGWDWIYADYVKHDPEWQRISDRFRAVYEQTDLLLRQPFAEPMDAFPRKMDLPLMAKRGNDARAMIADRMAADASKKWVLLSFTSLDLDQAALDRLSALSGYELFSVEPLEWPDSSVHCVSRAMVGFADMLASVDIVVTKPGFGIVSECIANDKPIIYSDRNHFREYGVLVDGIERYCRHAFIPNAELYAGQLSRALKEIESAPEPSETLARHGAEIAAGELLKRLNASS